MKNLKRRSSGFTLIELMIGLTIFMIMMLAVMPMFNISGDVFSSTEAHGQLKNYGQEAVNHIADALIECKRIFEGNTNDGAFLARLLMPGMPTAVSGSQLPKIEENGSISPSTSSFVSSSVGNSVFLASLYTPKDVSVYNSSGSAVTVRIDTYKFHYFYVALSSSAKPVGGQTRRSLYEWHSTPYLDFSQIRNITDTIKSSNTIVALKNAGYPYAWDSSTTSVTKAFFVLSSSGGLITNSTHYITIDASKSGDMLSFTQGISGSGFRYGVCPNTTTVRISYPVPAFSTGSAVFSNFPSGFEVVAVGPSSHRQVFMRLILIAEGRFDGTLAHQEVSLVNARDVW
jgi:type II secretory pathway pseudopilin PulG